MPFVTTVTAAQVRLLLDSISAAQLSDSNITAELSRSQNLLNDITDTNASQAEFDDACGALAAWMCYGKYTTAVGRQMGMIPDTTRWQLKHFQDIAELMINRISKQTYTLDPEYGRGNMIGLPPQVGLSTTEGYIQGP